jgi:uncharacterized membrane protein
MKIAVAIVHILFATIWLGGSFFYTLLLLPRLHVLDTANQRALTRSLRAVMTPLLAASALATIASGLVMMAQLHALHPGSFSHTRWGLFLVIGALASVAAAIAFVCEARYRREDGRPGSVSGRAGPLAPRESVLRLSALVLLLGALATMAVARYS